MVKMVAAEQSIVTGLRNFNSMPRAQIRALATDLGKLSRPAIVRIGTGLHEEGIQAPYDRLASLISASKVLSEQTSLDTSLGLDQIGRNRQTDQIEFSKATAVFQSERRDALLLNMARTHASWNTILKRDNLGTEIQNLLSGVPADVHGQTANWVMWAGHALAGLSSDPLTHEVHNFAVFLQGRLLRFENGYDTIGTICQLVEGLSNKIDKNATGILQSDASQAEMAYAERVKASISHVQDIAKAYRSFLPSEILTYSAEQSNVKQNAHEAVSFLFGEDDPAKSFLDMMKRANIRKACPNGSEAAMRWHAFFDKLMQQKESTGFDLGQFREEPVVGSYLALKGI